ncbi:unnamed protein product [Brassica rapa subsp. trilocularis]
MGAWMPFKGLLSLFLISSPNLFILKIFSLLASSFS